MTQFATETPVSTYKWVAPVRASTADMPLLNVNDLPSTTLMRTLGRALTTKRGDGSREEAGFVAWLCNRLPVTMIDGAGNIHVDTRFQPSHRSMFTAHTDTAHHGGGVNPVHVDGKFWRASPNSALGADDGAGVALLCHMIEAGVPGYYVFFRGEECGGIGSRWLSKEMPDLLAEFDRAVAFDRAGYADVITHQAGGRCCSDSFAAVLANALSTDDEWFLPDSTGVYTDTAEFIDQIPECTNISVGYKHQHGDREEQDVEFLVRLGARVVAVDWDALPTERSLVKVPRGFGGNLGRLDSSYLLDNDEDESYNRYLLDNDADSVMEAVVEAANTGDYAWLLDLIAEAVYPDDMRLARKNMNPRKLTEEVLNAAVEALETGLNSSEDILVNLYDVCATV